MGKRRCCDQAAQHAPLGAGREDLPVPERDREQYPHAVSIAANAGVMIATDYRHVEGIVGERTCQNIAGRRDLLRSQPAKLDSLQGARRLRGVGWVLRRARECS